MKNFKTNIIIAISTIAILGGNTLPVFAANNETNHAISTMPYEEIINFSDEVTTFADLGIMFDAWQNFVAEHPQSTESEQDDFLIQFVENGGLRNFPATQGVGDYLPGYDILNTAERELLFQHPVQAVKVFDCANKASSGTVEYYGSSNWGDNSDAFRHCSWNALMKKAMDSSAAEVWATAHEYDSSGIDKEMDLYNNAVGRSINVSNKSDSEIFEAVKGKVSNGNCQRIVNDSLVATDSSGLIK